jgi:putative CocE/NonD family hydrolase
MSIDVHAIIILACFVLPAVVLLAVDHPTSQPYATRPEPDGYLTYQILPVPDMVLIEKDMMVAMPDGIKLAANVYRPKKEGRFPVTLEMTPYSKDQSPPAHNPDGSFLPTSYTNYTARLYTGGIGLGHQKISMLTAFECAEPAFWVPNDYVVIIADARDTFKSEGNLASPAQGGDDLFHLIEWAGGQAWSNGNVGMIGVSALANNQYWAAFR